MNIVDDFDDKKYVVLKEVFDKDYCKTLVDHFFKLRENELTIKDEQCPLSDSVYGDELFDNVLESLAETFSDISGKKLFPTYSYARIYRKGEKLEIHRDRPACEISATLLLGFNGNQWPIYFSNNEDKSNSSTLSLEVGDAVLYKGCEAYHWRDEFEGEWLCQIFFHYVDSEGPYKDQKFDGRQKLGVKKQIDTDNKEDVIYYWYFENVLSSDYCDFIVGKYSHRTNEKGKIGQNVNGGVNTNVRNVNNLMIAMHEDIGAHLMGNAFLANQQAWNFNINMCNQIEYLKYDVNGRYKAHVDTFFNNQQYQRKLTALAFLNDDFEGGKLFLQASEQKIYPLQTKGTVIVFPSFMLHGVEDVTMGTRHSVVCWMMGPRFT